MKPQVVTIMWEKCNLFTFGRNIVCFKLNTKNMVMFQITINKTTLSAMEFPLLENNTKQTIIKIYAKKELLYA